MITVPVDWLIALIVLLVSGFAFWVKWEIMRCIRRLDAMSDRIDHVNERLDKRGADAR